MPHRLRPAVRSYSCALRGIGVAGQSDREARALFLARFDRDASVMCLDDPTRREQTQTAFRSTCSEERLEATRCRLTSHSAAIVAPEQLNLAARRANGHLDRLLRWLGRNAVLDGDGLFGVSEQDLVYEPHLIRIDIDEDLVTG